MTRPGIVRADTIDLQSQNSPSAQDHSRKPHIAASTAPHQAAELRHVQEERHSEEDILSNAWQNAHGLSDEPPSDDDVMRDDDQQTAQQNAQQRNGQAESADADGDTDMDDDMMDKISSSPSISDGGYSQFTTATTITPRVLPGRASPLYTPTPTYSAPVCRDTQYTDSPNVYDSNESSPFVTTPAHLPAPRPASPFPFRSALSRLRFARPRTPLCEEGELESEQSSSPFIESPIHFPLNYRENSSKIQSQVSHHHCSAEEANIVHAQQGTVQAREDHAEILDVVESEVDDPPEVPPKDKHYRPLKAQRVYQQPKLMKSASDIELEAQLLPIDDPLLDDDVFLDRQKSEIATPPTPVEEDDEGWETESDTKYSDDSFDSDAYDSFDSDAYDSDDDDDETCDCQLPADDRFIDSGWGGECLREIEDIDFEFVYALHTFVATVEGQANAQKGDTMVLLDDSNSYWWLVRVVKDSTIGYLPAEHIETPTERLARLNKHRNVDLSQTMLGDTTEKTKNPLKKAMRRRNAKTVQFTTPTYIEPSEYEYTTDEESDDDMSLTNGSTGGQVEQTKDQTTEGAPKDEISTVAPLKIKDKKRDMSPEKKAGGDDEDGDRRRKIDESRTSDEQFDREFSASSQKQSRNGTPRNTDSFFRDESIETRKITLTPNILRDDSSSTSTQGKSSLDRGPSLELLEKDPKPGKASKKEKKPGMLSGLFKRKEKKGKGDDASSTKGKLSGETLRESPSSEEASPIERPGTADSALLSRTGSKGKLQKAPPATSPPTGTMSPISNPNAAQKKPSAESISTTSSAQSTPRSGSPVNQDPSLQKSSSLRARAQESISSKLRTSNPTPEEAKPAKIKRAKTREALDIESSPDEETKDPFADSEVDQQTEGRLAAPPGPNKLGAMSSTERLSESPVHITSADAMPDSEPPALVGDSSSSSSDELTSLRSSPSPPMTSADRHLSPQASLDSITSPSQQTAHPFNKPISNPPPPTRQPPPQPSELAEATQRGLSPTRNNSTSTTNSALSPSTGSSVPAWSDAHLRAYMDNTEDVKDLLVVVHDTSGVVPVGPDHPLMSNLFVEERGKVKELDTALDKMLSQWLAKKRAASPSGPARKGSTPTPGSRLVIQQTNS